METNILPPARSLLLRSKWEPWIDNYNSSKPNLRCGKEEDSGAALPGWLTREAHWCLQAVMELHRTRDYSVGSQTQPVEEGVEKPTQRFYQQRRITLNMHLPSKEELNLMEEWIISFLPSRCSLKNTYACLFTHVHPTHTHTPLQITAFTGIFNSSGGSISFQ